MNNLLTCFKDGKVCLLVAAVALTMNLGACGSEDDAPKDPTLGNDNSTLDSIPTDTIATDEIYLTDEFVPHQGPIEPLTADLRPVLTPGKRWISLTKYNDDLSKTHYINDDYVIDRTDPLAAKISYPDDSAIAICTYGTTSANETQVTMFQHEKDGKVDYRWASFRPEFYPLYDVMAQKADSIITRNQHIYPISRGTITLMGRTRRAVKVWCSVDYDQCGFFWDKFKYIYDYWVEGIGMLYGHYPKTGYEMSNPYAYPIYRQLLQCWDGDDKIYDYREFTDDLYIPEEIFCDITDFPDYQKPWYND